MLRGDGLDVLLKAESFLPPTRALPIFVQIAEALVHAQQKSIVHERFEAQQYFDDENT